MPKQKKTVVNEINNNVAKIAEKIGSNTNEKLILPVALMALGASLMQFDYLKFGGSLLILSGSLWFTMEAVLAFGESMKNLLKTKNLFGNKKLVLLISLVLLSVSLLLSLVSSYFNNEKNELFQEKIKEQQETTNWLTDITVNLQKSAILSTVENVSYAQCDDPAYSRMGTCTALSNAIKLEDYVIPRLNNTLNDSFSDKITALSRNQDLADSCNLFLIIVVIFMGLLVFLTAKEKEL